MAIAAQLTIEDIRTRLAAHTPRILPHNRRSHAAVAMVLRAGSSATEALFIIRALHEQDPWSGNIGFPGGRLNPGVESPRQAAERETREELGLNLDRAEHLGRLDDLYGATLPVLVSCFVYQLKQETTLQPNHEVAKAFWYPLPQLLAEERHQRTDINFRGEQKAHPAIKILETGEPLLWGITYRLLADFFALCDRPFPPKTEGSFP